MGVSRAMSGLAAAASMLVATAVVPAAAAPDDRVGWITADITKAYPDGQLVDGRWVVAPSAEADAGRESTLAALVADAYKAAMREPVVPQIGIVSPTALGADLLHDDPDPEYPRGPGEPVPSRVTRADVAATLPAGEELWQTVLDGAQLRRLLEQQWRAEVPRPERVQLGLSSNVGYTYDESSPRGGRITSITVDGRPIDPWQEYQLLSARSLIEGGHGFSVLAEGQGTGPATAGPDRTDRDALASHLLRLYHPVAPDVRERAVGLAELPRVVAPGARVQVDVAGLDLTSAGAPANTAVTVLLDDVPLAVDAPLLRTGTEAAASVSVTVPPGTGPRPTLRVVATPTGSEATAVLPVAVASETQVVALPWSQVYGDLSVPVVMRATVEPSDLVTGTVDLMLDGTLVGTRPLVDGRAELAIPTLTPGGSHFVTARYSGDGAFPPSESLSWVITVTAARSATTLTTHASPVAWLPSVWTSRVRLESGADAVGVVELRAGTRTVARSRVVEGRAAGTIPGLTSGTHRLTAVFVPDHRPSMTGSTSPAVTYRR